MSRKWTRVSDAGWLQGRPGYESGPWFIAQDYDSEDSAKIVWFVHHEDTGYITACDTLREAKEHVPDDD